MFLDRDGVLNAPQVRDGKPYPPDSIADLRILPGVREALAQLKAAQFLLIVVSNQPDVGRGTTTQDAVEAINAALAARLPIDEFRMCYHGGDEACGCRKPRPGMLLDAAKKWDIDLSSSFMVGDRWRDVEAGKAAGCKTIFIDYAYSEKQPTHVDCRVTSLLDAVPFVLS